MCLRLAEAVGETVNIAVPQDGDTVNISQVRGPAAISGHNWVGQRTPSHATSSGKVLLAFGALRLPAELERYTPRRITDARRLGLAEIRERGWAITVEELEVGLNAVAAPIRGSDGSVVAAVSASGPVLPAHPGAAARGGRAPGRGREGDKPAHRLLPLRACAEASRPCARRTPRT